MGACHSKIHVGIYRFFFFLFHCNKNKTDLDLGVKNNAKSKFFASLKYGRTAEQNDTATNYNPSNYTDNSHWGDFKQPMTPPLTNGSKRVPGLISATQRPLERTIFHRSLNLPHQTVNPHFSKYGELSELSNFKNVPELYPIGKANRPNASGSYSSSGHLVNGHEQSIFSSTKFGNQINQRNSSNDATTYLTNMVENVSPILNNSIANRASTSMNVKTNSKCFNVSQIRNQTNIGRHFLMHSGYYLQAADVIPPANLSRSRYQILLDMVPGYKYISRCKYSL